MTYSPPLTSPPASFATLAEPIATTTPATNIASTSAQFNGTVNARNFDTEVVFEWGTDGKVFLKNEPVSAMVTGNTDTPVNVPVAGLPEGGTVFYRLRAKM
jgi:hypothetical protein